MCNRKLLPVIGIMLLALTGCQETIPPGCGEALSAMTFNVRYDNPNDGVDAWPNRAEWVASVIGSMGPDIVGLQEVLRHQADTLSALLPDYDWFGVGRDDGVSGGEFSPVFFKPACVEPLDLQTWWLSASPAEKGSVGWDAALPRVATAANFLWAGDTVRVVNTHFDHRGQTARLESARMLADSLARYRPAVLLGDLNFAPETEAYQALAESGLSDAFVEAGSPLPEETFTGFDATEDPGARIDYVWVRGLRVEEYRAVTEIRDGRYVSDHRPVFVRLRPAP